MVNLHRFVFPTETTLNPQDVGSITHGNTAHFSQRFLQSTGDCLYDYPITIQQILQRHKGVMSFFSTKCTWQS